MFSVLVFLLPTLTQEILWTNRLKWLGDWGEKYKQTAGVFPLLQLLGDSSIDQLGFIWWCTDWSFEAGSLAQWSHLLCERSCLSIRVMRHWHKLSREVMGALFLETLKVRLDGALSTWCSCRCPCSLQGIWTRWSLRVPSNSNDSVWADADLDLLVGARWVCWKTEVS